MHILWLVRTTLPQEAAACGGASALGLGANGEPGGKVRHGEPGLFWPMRSSDLGLCSRLF